MSRAAIAALLVATAVAPASGSVSRRSAFLTVTSMQPLQVRGRRFAPRERVRVIVSLPARGSRTVIATSSGTFTVRFRRIYVGRCGALAVRGRGDHGSTAALRIASMCLPPEPIARVASRL